MVVFEKYLIPGMGWVVAFLMVTIGFGIMFSATSKSEKEDKTAEDEVKEADDSIDMKKFLKGMLLILIGLGIGLYTAFAGGKIA